MGFGLDAPREVSTRSRTTRAACAGQPALGCAISTGGISSKSQLNSAWLGVGLGLGLGL